MSDWYKEAAWMVHPKNGPWIHPKTIIQIYPATGYVKLTAHKVADFSVILPPSHPLAVLAKERSNNGRVEGDI